MKFVIDRLVVLGLLLLLVVFSADAQNVWRHKTHDVYEALTGVEIEIDGDLADWEGVFEAVTGTNGKPFVGLDCGINRAFEEHGGGKWNGKADHETALMMAWEPAAFYVGLIITDDEHENDANSGWNGDAFQFAIEMTGKRKGSLKLLLYNLALGGNGKIVIHNEVVGGQGLTENEVAIVRDEGAKKTFYEVKISADEAGLKGKFEADMKIGVGICVNDGDLAAGQEGQKGWSGWYTHAIVFGKNSEETGLVHLTKEVLAVDPKGKLTTRWAEIKRK